MMDKKTFTRDDLARVCGVDHQTITHWLNYVISPFLARAGIPSGAKLYTEEQMMQICTYLGVTMP